MMNDEYVDEYGDDKDESENSRIREQLCITKVIFFIYVYTNNDNQSLRLIAILIMFKLHDYTSERAQKA